MWGWLAPPQHPVFPTPTVSGTPYPLPAVIQDTVGDEELTEEVPDVSVGPVLGGQSGVRGPLPHLPLATREEPTRGCFLVPEGGPLADALVRLTDLHRQATGCGRKALIPAPSRACGCEPAGSRPACAGLEMGPSCAF